MAFSINQISTITVSGASLGTANIWTNNNTWTGSTNVFKRSSATVFSVQNTAGTTSYFYVDSSTAAGVVFFKSGMTIQLGVASVGNYTGYIGPLANSATICGQIQFGISIINGATSVVALVIGSNTAAANGTYYVATHSCVLDDGAGGQSRKGLKMNINPQNTSPYTATANDDLIVITTGAGGFTLNLPAATGSGQIYRIIKGDSGAGAVTVTPNGADTINGAANISLATQYKTATLVDGKSAVWYDITANLV